jgi:hypothetical protein
VVGVAAGAAVDVDESLLELPQAAKPSAALTTSTTEIERRSIWPSPEMRTSE